MRNINLIMTDAKSRFNFIKGLICISKASEIEEGVIGINTEEKRFLENAMESLDINKSDRAVLEALITAKENDTNIAFENQEQALFLLREGVQVCYIDGKYSEAERKLVEVLAEKFGVSKKSVEAIEKWVEAGIRWEEQGDELLKSVF
jgi:uncharacterized tellurite resistance protein B-like protein